MTIQEQIKAKLAHAGIAHKEIKVYGSQIMITTRGKASAEKFATLVGKFATVRRVWEGVDYDAVNVGSMMNPSTHKVWRVAAVI